MKFKTVVGTVVLGAFFGLSQAQASDAPENLTEPAAKPKYETEYGRTLPPIGYVDYCGRNPGECKPYGRSSNKVTMSPDRWNLLYQVNTYVNGKVAPITDQDLYGQPEFWAMPTDAGDCEDYVLLKKRFLENLGFPASALLITVLLDENQQGHAVLTVVTDAGDYILDNRREDVLRWSDANYTYLKRQSQADPNSWVALAKEKTMTAGFIAGGSK